MNNKDTSNATDMKGVGYELFIMLLSMLSIFNLVVILAPVDTVLNRVVLIMDGVITIIFMLDFLYRLFTAESKKDYFFRNWGWADLLASLPAGQLKIFRIFRMVRVIRILHTFGWRKILDELLHQRAGSALFLTLIIVIFVLEFGALAIVSVEADAPEANILNASDGVWWTFVTITTVGYGDRYPVTDTGRLIAMLVMALGVGTFGVLTGFLANAFIPADNDTQEELGGVPSAAEMLDIRRLLEEQQRINAALQLRLDQIETQT